MGKTEPRGAAGVSLTVEAWPLDRPKPYPGNPRIITDAAIAKVKQSLLDHGWRQPVVVCAKEEIVVGHTRRLAAAEIHADGLEIPNWPDTGLVPVHPSGMSEDEARAYRLADNRTGEEAEWDSDQLKIEIDALFDAGFDIQITGFDEIDLSGVFGGLGSSEPNTSKGSGVLAETFGVPPFSVLSARAGWWQERKQAWLALGIESELGRDETFGAMGRLYEKAEGKAAGAWASTSVFDPVLCELVYRWLCPPGGMVLDPFAGGSVRGVVASRLDRTYTGIELRAEQVEANKAQSGLCTGAPVDWITGDSTELAALVPGVEADLVFTCPPYADLEKYSDDPRDLSQMAYGDFIDAYARIIKAAADALKPDRFACVVVGEVRRRDGVYRGFVPDTIRAFEEAGLSFYNEAVLVTQVGTLAMRARKQFETSRKLGKAHQNVLVFCKGSARKAAEAIGKCQFSTDPLEGGGSE